MRVVPIRAMFAAAMLGSFAALAGAQHTSDGPAQTLFESANHARVARRLAPLKWSASLEETARQHALLLARQNTLSHQLAGEPPLSDRAARAGARFSTIAENVAEGPNAEGIHEQWMNSPPHRANLLDPQLDSVGIAVAENNGTLFAVEDFSLAAGSLSVTEQEKIVSVQLQSLGLHLLNDLDDARRSCSLDNGYAGSHQPSFVLHYATPDLQSLPDILKKRIQTGKYHSAVVGACPSDSTIGLSNYRIAVLLYE